MDTSEEKHQIEILKIQYNIWKTAVETQMHFNDLIVKTRQLFLFYNCSIVSSSPLFSKRKFNPIFHRH